MQEHVEAERFSRFSGDSFSPEAGKQEDSERWKEIKELKKLGELKELKADTPWNEWIVLLQ